MLVSEVPVGMESIREEISEYHVIGVLPIKPNFIELTCKLIVTALMTDTTTRRGPAGAFSKRFLVRPPGPPPSFGKRLRWILIDTKHVSRFTW